MSDVDVMEQVQDSLVLVESVFSEIRQWFECYEFPKETQQTAVLMLNGVNGNLQELIRILQKADKTDRR
ncbi:MAG: hypothetical protein OXP71_16355 [Candidatus Poribacteria bacterium]|nr:hypothetical protein [Candidatus Poribacteria bacterium]